MKNTLKTLSIFLSATALTFADNENFDGLTISGKDLLGGSYKNSSWIGTTIKESTFTATKFNESNFSTAKINESNFENVDISDSIFDEAEFNNVKFTGSTAKNTSFKKAKIVGSSVSFNSGTFDGSDFSEAILSKSGMPSKEAAWSASFENSSLIGANFSKTQLATIFSANITGWMKWTESSVNFTGADLTGANFSDAHLVSSYNGSFSPSTSIAARGIGVIFSKSTKLKSVNFTNAILGDNVYNVIGLNLAEFDLSDCNFTNAVLKGVSFTDSVITNVNFSNARNLTTDQLSATKNYKNKNLSGIKFNGLDLTDWNLSGQNLQNTSFNAANLTGVNASNADLRGADLTDITGSLKTQNTIWTDGSIKNFSMTSKNDNLTIRAYVPTTSGGEMINAKIADDATISGGAVLTLEEGAILEIMAGKTLTVADDSEIIFNVDVASNNTKILLNSGSTLAFGEDSKVTINLDGVISPDDSYTFSVIEAAADACISGADAISKDNLVLNVNGEAYDSDKWGFNFDPTTGALTINVNVPEPATVAAIFGAVALALAVYRRRR